MIDRYYIPNLEDIHYGLVIEIYDYNYDNRNDNNKYWQKITIDEENISSIVRYLKIFKKSLDSEYPHENLIYKNITMDFLQKARQNFIKIIERQNAQWELIENHLIEDEDTPVKPYIFKKKSIKKTKINNES